MKSKNWWLFFLLLLVGYLELFRGFQFYFAGTDRLKHQLSQLKEKLNQEKLKAAVAQYQFEDLRQEVATQIPAMADHLNKGDQTGFRLRTLASVTQRASDKIHLERAGSLFEKGKKFFRERNYSRANKIFAKLVKTYPESVYSLESYFFLVEGLFQTRELEDCVMNIEFMMTHYPENELTGFALLRLGKVYEIQERLEDAAEVYRTISHNYHNPELKTQAGIFLKAIQL